MGLVFGEGPGRNVIPLRCSISATYSSTSDRNSTPSSTVEEKTAQCNHSTKVSRSSEGMGTKLNQAERAGKSSEPSEQMHFMMSSLRCSRVSTGCLAGYMRPRLRRLVRAGGGDHGKY